MAGEHLIELLKSKGGKPSDYADVVYGIVTSIKPLKVQLSNQMILTDDFITVGKHIGKFKIKGKGKGKFEIKSHHDEVGPASGNRPTVTENAEILKDFEFEFDNELKKGDKVTLIRGDGGQRFYLFERKGTDGFGY